MRTVLASLALMLAAASSAAAGTIVYDGNCNGTIGGVAARGGICVMPDDGSAAPRLVLQFGDFPRWSPDGTRFAYQTTNNTAISPPGGFQIAIANADGSGAHPITADGSDTHQNTTPAWSPDGRQIVFDRGGPGTVPTIEVVNADGSGRRTVIANGLEPQFSADGSRIVFLRGGDVYSVALDGTGLRQLTLGGALGAAVPSPDGSRYALAIPHGNLSDVWTMNTDGSGLRRITPAGAWTYPAWSSDGSQLLADRQQVPGQDSAVDIYRFDFTDAPVRLTASTGFLDSALFPDWWVPGRPHPTSAGAPAAPVPIAFTPSPVSFAPGAAAAALPHMSAKRAKLRVAALSRAGGRGLKVAVVRGGQRPHFADARTVAAQKRIFGRLRRGSYRLLVRTTSRSGRTATRTARLRITG